MFIVATDPARQRGDGAGASGQGGGSQLADPALTLLPTPVADNSRGLPSSQTDYQSLANVAAALTD